MFRLCLRMLSTVSHLNKELVITNVANTTSLSDLEELIPHAKIQISKSIYLAKFTTVEEAEEVLKKLDGFELHGNELKLKFNQYRENDSLHQTHHTRINEQSKIFHIRKDFDL